MEKYCERHFEAGSLTREQFIEMLAQDFIAAKKVYDALERTRVRRSWREARDKAREEIKEELVKKYKRQSTRDKYAMPMLEKWIEDNQWKYKFHALNAIKFSIKPWENGGCYYVYIDKTMHDYRGKMWDMHINNKYLHGCTGWCVVFDKYDHYLKLELSEELEAQWEEDERKLGEAISRFYKGSNYWGD
jgi:hypothetical protein